LFLLKKMHVDAPCGGYGELLQIDDVFPY
jgi:hypothetical protein